LHKGVEAHCNHTGKITGKDDMQIPWANYKIGVVHTLSVELASWPKDIAITCPSKIAAADLRRLINKLRDGSMAWVLLTKSQREATAAEVEELHESGAVKKRGPRTKKNKKKNTKARESEEDEVGEDKSEDEDEDKDKGEDKDDTSCTSTILPSITCAPVGHVSGRQLAAPAAQASTAAIAAASFPDMSFPGTAPAAESPAAATVVVSFPAHLPRSPAWISDLSLCTTRPLIPSTSRGWTLTYPSTPSSSHPKPTLTLPTMAPFGTSTPRIAKMAGLMHLTRLV
jgi:hypothetical protein